MKLETPKQDVAINGDFATSDYAVGDVAFIVDMFADKVYTYKERAVIRELSCNAHDSHVMAGTLDTPFKVHLPTHLEPWFLIRDFGTGLDDAEVRNIFAGVGISTKRDSNETIGCFGIGSLSPYSLCDSFSVKSYKDGYCRTYSCYRDAERKPVVAQLSEEASDEPNGLEVMLTIDGRVGKFEDEAVNVFKWWDYTPDINNKDVVRRCENHRKGYAFKGADYCMNSGWGDTYAVMGNIAYRIPDEHDVFECDGFIKFELGEISFDTARENLSLDEKTVAALKAKFDRISEEIAADAVAKIEEESCPMQRAILVDKLRGGQLGRLLKGAKLNQYDLPKTTEPMTYWRRSWRSTDCSTTESLPLSENCEYYLQADRMQSRIKNYLKEHNSNAVVVILTQEQADECLIDQSLLRNLEDLPKVVRHYDRSTGSKVKTFAFDRSYSGYTDKDSWDEVEIENDGSEIVYVEISRWKPVNGEEYISTYCRQIKECLRTLESHKIDVPTVVGLKTAFLKTKAFKKGNFITLADYVKRELAKYAPTEYHKFDKDDLTKIKAIAKHVEHDDLTAIVDLSNDSKNDELAKICKRIGIVAELQENTVLQEMMDEFFDEHEMLKLFDDWRISRNIEMVSRYIGGTLKK